MRNVLILDLDGTVLSVNSFRLWASYMLRAASPHMAPGRRLGLALRAGGALLARKAGLMGHEALKHHLQSLWQRSTAGDGGATLAHFNDGLRRYVRPELQPLLSAVAAGRIDGVLATAAAADYAQHFGGLLGISHVLATQANRPRTMPSNIGPHKRDAVLDFLARQGWMERPRILFTDHEDDLPLIEICGTVHWFGPAAALPALATRFPHAALHQGFTNPEDRRQRC